MGLKEGNLESLIERGCSPNPEHVFHQMLQALDCLASADIIHRDVKPENILWMTGSNGQYQFQLGDFGLCNRGVSARTRGVGTPIYMAPEVWEHLKQTTKADIWSLYITMLWVLDVNGFRQACLRFTDFDDVRTIVIEASKQENLARIRSMADPNPITRASAAEMLLNCFNGAGLITPRNVPAPAPHPAVQTTRNKTAEKLPFQKDTNIFAGATGYHIENLQHPP